MMQSSEKSDQTQSLKIISWNVGSLRTLAKKSSWNEILEMQPDILCLQETRCALREIPSKMFQLGYPFVFFLR